MAFMMKKKKYKFQVEILLEDLTAVPFVNAVLFAKLRLLDGGNFIETSSREEVKEHTVRWAARFEFVCKMSANASTGVLDPCILRVSVRKESKGGRSFQKLGFTDLNLAEFAGSGQTSRRCLLEGYDTRHRQDNSMLQLSIRMNMLSGDILFKVPSPSLKHKQLIPPPVAADEDLVTPVDRRCDDFSSGSLAGSIASGSSGFGSLPKKRPQLFASELITGNPNLPESGVVGQQPPLETTVELAELQISSVVTTTTAEEGSHEPGHSRNSSNTSQMSKASGYSSLSQSQHSRQSSSGDSGHIRNASSGSGLSETGSLDRAKAAMERRKKNEEAGLGLASLVGGCAPPGRVEVTRVDPDSLITELLRSTNLEPSDESAETSGLTLFIAKDGTTALGSHEVKSQMNAGVFKQVVMESDESCLMRDAFKRFSCRWEKNLCHQIGEDVEYE